MLEASYNLRVDGQLYQGWTSMMLKRSIERMAGEFRISASNTPDDEALIGNIEEGAPCVFEINDTPVLEGYVDLVSPSYAKNNSSIEISGRDKVGDLLDCAATVNGPYEFNGMTLDRVIKAVLKPYNIPLTVLAEVGAPFKRLAIQPGERAFDFIERACRFRAILPISDGIGGLVLTKPGKIKSAGKLVYGQNILSARGSRNYKDRFSHYVIKGQAEAIKGSKSEELNSAEGRARDETVSRYRPTVITSEAQAFDLTLNERAKWQASINKARARKVSYTVAGWFADGVSELWKPNTIVPVTDPKMKIMREMLIVGASYSRSESGTTTDLELVIPEALNIPAEKQDENGWN